MRLLIPHCLRDAVWPLAASYHSHRALRKAPRFTLAQAFASLEPMVASKVSQGSPRLRGIEPLASRGNRWLRRFRAALRGGEALDGCVGVEGPRLVEEALRSGLQVEAVLVSAAGERHFADMEDRLDAGVRLLRASDRLFAGVADTETPQGIAALVRAHRATFDEILGGAQASAALVVVLVGVQDPGNVGTILRAAEAFGATGAATCAAGSIGSANPLAPKALRSSAGAALRLPVVQGVGAAVLLAQLRIAGVKLYAASVLASQAGGARPVLNPWQADLHGPAALLIGNEGAGLPGEVERSADALVRIPLAAGVDSLNAASAAAVLLYEAARQRGLRQ